VLLASVITIRHNSPVIKKGNPVGLPFFVLLYRFPFLPVSLW
jgi:hypothetical protein